MGVQNKDKNSKMTLDIKLLGQPRILVNNKNIRFPYKKAEALLYYVLIKKRLSKDQIGDVLWPNEGEIELVKKNIRNAIYTIRKLMGKDFLIKLGTDMVGVNPATEIKLDIAMFHMNEEDANLDLYQGDFLEGFFLKDNIEFEEWIEFKRQEYRDVFTDWSINAVRRMIEESDIHKAKKYCKRLIKLDEFDERSYRLLIEAYKSEGAYNKCLNVYNKLAKLLSEEILVSPEMVTKDLIDGVKDLRIQEQLKIKQALLTEISDQGTKNLHHKIKYAFYGRASEVEMINDQMNRFAKGLSAKSIMLSGEEGIGKSATIQHAMNNIPSYDGHIISTQCYRAEEKYILKPWNAIFSVLSDIIEELDIQIPKSILQMIETVFPGFSSEKSNTLVDYEEELSLINYHSAEKAIVELIRLVGSRQKLIFNFDDIQWADELSLSIIRTILTTDCNKTVLFIFTSRLNCKRTNESFVLDMTSYELMENVYLKRFTESEVLAFAKDNLPLEHSKNSILKQVYKESEGNLFFLVELLNGINEDKNFVGITPKIQDVLKNRVHQISDKGKKVLDILAIYFDKLDFETLEKISLINGFELVDIADELVRKNIIVEKGDLQEVSYVFTHQKIREYVYSVMSLSKKRLLHNRAGEIIETKLSGVKSDILYYHQLIYHYERCGKKLKVFKYKLRYLYECLQFSHEIFPLVDVKKPSVRTHMNQIVSPDQISEFVSGMEDVVELLMTDMSTKENRDLISQYLHMVGRSYIRQGNYSRGLDYINKLIELSLNNGNTTYLVKAYRQQMCYYINTYQLDNMKKTIKEAYSVVESQSNVDEMKTGSKEDLAVWWRLDGLMNIMNGQYSKGQSLLRNAIEVFENSSERGKYISNLAVAYNWIGESKRYEGAYTEAIELYDKAIELNNEQGLSEALSVFNTNAGQAAFDMKNYDLARKYLTVAISNYEQMDALWCRSLAHSYNGRVLFELKDYTEAVDQLKKAYGYAKKIKSPYECGVYYRVVAELKCTILKMNIDDQTLNTYLDQPLEYYCNHALAHLNQTHNTYDIQIVKNILENK